MTPWTVAHQAPLPVEFSRQESWSGLPFPSPGDLPDLWIEPRYPALAGKFFITKLPGKPSSLPRQPQYHCRSPGFKNLPLPTHLPCYHHSYQPWTWIIAGNFLLFASKTYRRKLNYVTDSENTMPLLIHGITFLKKFSAWKTPFHLLTQLKCHFLSGSASITLFCASKSTLHIPL